MQRHTALNVKRIWAFLLAALLFQGVVMSSAAQASMIGAEAVLDTPAATDAAATNQARADLQQALVEYGVAPEQAKERVARLSDAKALQLAERVNSAPAGGDFWGAAVVVFLVLLATDVLGYTDIFPFVKKAR